MPMHPMGYIIRAEMIVLKNVFASTAHCSKAHVGASGILPRQTLTAWAHGTVKLKPIIQIHI